MDAYGRSSDIPTPGDIGIFAAIGNTSTRESFSRNIDRMELYLHNLIVVKSFVAGELRSHQSRWSCQRPFPRGRFRLRQDGLWAGREARRRGGLESALEEA